MMTEYKPLAAIASFDQERSYFYRLKKWIGDHIPIVLYAESDCHRTIAEQLLSRPVFPTDKWEEMGYNANRVEEILRLLAEHFDWPNHHFIPSDSLRLVLTEGKNEFGLEESLIDIRDAFGLSIDRSKVIELYQRGDLVELLGLPEFEKIMKI